LIFLDVFHGKHVKLAETARDSFSLLSSEKFIGNL
jgi:hypothetical protein